MPAYDRNGEGRKNFWRDLTAFRAVKSLQTLCLLPFSGGMGHKSPTHNRFANGIKAGREGEIARNWMEEWRFTPFFHPISGKMMVCVVTRAGEKGIGRGVRGPSFSFALCGSNNFCVVS